jgi:hypothetical protein
MMLPFMFAAVLAGDPSITARTVVLHDMDIIPLTAQVGYVTEIHFPKGEMPMDFGGGERTTVNVPLTSGHHATFLIEEVSKKKGAHADLKVFIQEDDVDSKVPAFVPIERLASVVSDNEKLRLQLADTQRNHTVETKAIVQEVAREVRTDYELFDRKGKQDFKPEVYAVKGFTYIKLDTAELPSVWSVKDGKPSKLNPTFANGVYEIQGMLDEGQLSVGKSSIKFRRMKG